MKNKQLNQVLIALFLLFMYLWACESTDSSPQGSMTPEIALDVTRPEETSEPEEFVITKEIYDKTFDEIDDIIERLNTTITWKDYQAWKGFLSPSYVLAKSNSVYLSELSAQPKLVSQGIVLETLYDYFIYVIVPSRAMLKLDEISFEDKSHVKAYTIINGKKLILYYLERIENQWKIANW